MLHHWLASLKEFSIKWRQAFRTCLNRKKKTSVKTDTKLKAQSKCGESFSIFFPQNLALLFPREREYDDKILPFFSIFRILAKFRPKKTLLGPQMVYLVIILPPIFTWGVQRLSCVCHTHFPPLSFFTQGFLFESQREKIGISKTSHPGPFFYKNIMFLIYFYFF
jgi:hypothetical protein